MGQHLLDGDDVERQLHWVLPWMARWLVAIIAQSAQPAGNRVELLEPGRGLAPAAVVHQRGTRRIFARLADPMGPQAPPGHQHAIAPLHVTHHPRGAPPPPVATADPTPAA